HASGPAMVAPSRARVPCTMVVLEPDRAHDSRELLGAAAALTGSVLAVTLDEPNTKTLLGWGANEIVRLEGENIEEDVARAVGDLAARELPWAILTGSTAWGREVASRVAVRLDAGLVGDAVELDADDGRLVAWKPAFGGQLVAAIGYTSATQMATVRPGMLPLLTPRPVNGGIDYETIPLVASGRL